MKRLYFILTIVLLVAIKAFCQQQYSARHDSLYVYNSWESIMDQWADTVLINPEVSIWTPYDIEFDTHNRKMNKILKEVTVAVAVGDTIWMVNTDWLSDNFKGEAKKMDDYAPLFFNSKVAFVQCVPNRTSIGLSLLYSPDPWNDEADLYWIDFEQKRVDRIDHKKLSSLLSIYPDLQRRYEQMADYKERYMIHSFFIDFVKRTERDPNYPYLLDRLYPPSALQ